MTAPVLLTTSEVAKATGIPVSTLTRWARTGVLKPAHKLPRRTGAYLFHPHDVAALSPPRPAK